MYLIFHNSFYNDTVAEQSWVRAQNEDLHLTSDVTNESRLKNVWMDYLNIMPNL
jgi:hypothetical protein